MSDWHRALKASWGERIDLRLELGRPPGAGEEGILSGRCVPYAGYVVVFTDENATWP